MPVVTQSLCATDSGLRASKQASKQARKQASKHASKQEQLMQTLAQTDCAGISTVTAYPRPFSLQRGQVQYNDKASDDADKTTLSDCKPYPGDLGVLCSRQRPHTAMSNCVDCRSLWMYAATPSLHVSLRTAQQTYSWLVAPQNKAHRCHSTMQRAHKLQKQTAAAPTCSIPEQPAHPETKRLTV